MQYYPPVILTRLFAVNNEDDLLTVNQTNGGDVKAAPTINDWMLN